MSALECQVFDIQGKPIKKIHLPEIFQTPLRADIIRRAVLAAQSHRFQPQGRDIMAGRRTSAESMGVGYDLARVPRVKGRGFPRAGAGVFAPGTVGGREAHPPVVEKIISKRINKKERRFAIRSAIAATAHKQIVASRGHYVEAVPSFPLVVSNDVQGIKTAADVRTLFVGLGVWSDVLRVKENIKVRGGKGKKRGRRLKVGKAPLIVVTEDRGIVKAASNYPGVDVVKVENLNAELLAPGTHPGRLTVWAESAIEKLGGLFR